MRIVHISDLHFGYHHETLIKPFLQDLAQFNPDVILISGDVTHRATAQQYAAFNVFLKRLPAPALIVPGNHDIPLHHVLERLLVPFRRFKRYVHADLSVKWSNEKVRVLGINSVNPYRIKDGRLSNDTLAEIRTYFSTPFEGINILFFHHNFAFSEGLHKPLENFEALLTLLKESPIHLVCTGHLHYASLNLLERPNRRPCVILHAGSLLCQRSKDGLNSYYIIDIEKGTLTFDWRVFKAGHFESMKRSVVDV